MLKVKDAAGVWQDITGTGVTGPSGGPVPTGGNPGEVIQKVGVADFDVGWTERPRVALNLMVASIVSPATVNVMTAYPALTADVTIHPDRWYHIFASHRCIQDPGTGMNVQMQVALGTVNLAGYDVVTCTDPNTLWGAWAQSWLNPGTTFTAVTASLSLRLNYLGSVASKTIYTPRIYCVEY